MSHCFLVTKLEKKCCHMLVISSCRFMQSHTSTESTDQYSDIDVTSIACHKDSHQSLYPAAITKHTEIIIQEYQFSQKNDNVRTSWP